MGFANVKPLVSVIIPVERGDRYIERAVTSVLQQKNCNYEILVIDRGSSDRTSEILATYSERLRYFRQQQGLAAALNLGITLAQGDLITFLAADEYYLPNKLVSQAAIFVRRNNIGMVDSGWQTIEADEREQLTVCPWQSIPKLDLEAWLARSALVPGTMMFRHEWLKYVGGFDEKFPGAEAWNLVLKLALKGCQAEWLKQVTVGCQHKYPAIENSLLQANSVNAVLDDFFTQPDLPLTIRSLKNSVSYRTLVELAWYLDCRGQRVETMAYLKRAWSYRSALATETVVDWIESFARHSRERKLDFDVNSLTLAAEWQQLLKWTMEITDKSGSN
ncbi:glycosyltransferase [Myxosarcina sp. GI1]|uniref:glycosyltransferase n=1 Tax=Myxosarcina sp. GI1 TaxID=1541065 RepID=UPI00056A4702|nr:glycosyltransferase [Myxosarcina sp. GI1]